MVVSEAGGATKTKPRATRAGQPATDGLKVDRLEVVHAPDAPPPADKGGPNRAFQIRMAVTLATIASIVFAAIALATQKDRTTGIVFLALAGVLAAVPLAAIVRAKRSVYHPSRLPAAIAIVAMLGVAAFQVVDLSCTERLGPRADLRGCDFAGTDLRTSDLAGADLRDANLQRATIRNLRSANLEGADLSNARLAGAVMTGATLRDASLDGADLGRARLGGVKAEGASFKNASLTATDLAGSDLDRASFAGATMNGVTLTQASLAGADLKGAMLDGAILATASFAGANLAGASLVRVTALQADFSSATLQGANLSEATFESALFEKATLTDGTLTASTFQRARMAGAVFDGVNATNIDFGSADLQGASLRNVNLSGARLSGADLQGATLKDLTLDRASFVGTTGYTDSALAASLGISRVALPRYATRHEITFDLRADILSRLGDVRVGRPLRQAAAFKGTFHPLVVLDGKGNTFAWTQDASAAGWEPTALRFGQLVAFVTQSEKVVQRCNYRSFTTGLPGSITRYRHVARVRVLSARTGNEVLDRTYRGSNPNACPDVAPYQRAGRIDGSTVEFERVKAALRGLVF